MSTMTRIVITEIQDITHWAYPWHWKVSYDGLVKATGVAPTRGEAHCRANDHVGGQNGLTCLEFVLYPNLYSGLQNVPVRTLNRERPSFSSLSPSSQNNSLP